MGQGFALFAGIARDVIRASAREAEALGYSSFWVNHPGSTDGLGALAEAAAATRDVALGVGVIPLHTRSPTSIVEGVRETRLPLERLLLSAVADRSDHPLWRSICCSDDVSTSFGVSILSVLSPEPVFALPLTASALVEHGVKASHYPFCVFRMQQTHYPLNSGTYLFVSVSEQFPQPFVPLESIRHHIPVVNRVVAHAGRVSVALFAFLKSHLTLGQCLIGRFHVGHLHLELDGLLLEEFLLTRELTSLL